MIVVAPRWSRRPPAECHASLLRHIGKCPVMVVVIQPVLAVVRHVDVRPAVVIVVTHGHAKSPTFVCNARFFRDIGERSVMVVVQ